MAAERIEGWKAIAAYLGVSIRTAQRWERDNRLPVRRAMRRSRESISAEAAELAAWRVANEQATGAEPLTIAVLPFAGGDSIAGSALAGELIETLSRASELRVISRTSSFAPALREQTIPEIAATLGANYFLEGEIESDGTAGTLRMRLVDAEGYTVYARGFDCGLPELGRFPQRIARAVCAQLRIRFFGAPRRPPRHAEAERRRLRGKALFLEGTPEGASEGLRLAASAVALDPNYGPAHADVGMMHSLMAMAGSPPKPHTAAAGEHLRRAVSLDPALADARYWLGRHLGVSEHNWLAAGEQFQRALALDPNHGMGLYFYGADFLRLLGRYEDSIRVLERARRNDPLNPQLPFGIAQAYWQLGDRKEALREAESGLEAAGGAWIATWFLGALLLDQGEVARALELLEQSWRLAPPFSWVTPTLANARRMAGDERGARRILDQARKQREAEYLQPTVLAYLYALFGETERALDWFEAAYTEGDPLLSYLPRGTTGVFLLREQEAAFRAHPRWRRLEEHMGLADAGPSLATLPAEA
jgi:tetratricopeptide (TPR) repeat protein